MSKCKIAASTFVLLLLPVASLAASEGVPPDEKVKKDLPALEDAVCRANVAFDGPFFEKLTAHEAIFTLPNGATLSRDDVLQAFHAPASTPRAYKLESCKNDDVVVRPLGAAAVVTGVVTVKGLGPNGPYTDISRYTHTLVWRDQRWQLVAAHGSHLPDKT